MSGANRWQSIDRKLPLAISGLLLVTVATFSVAAYARVRRVVLEAAGERLLTSSVPVSAMLEQSAELTKGQLRRTASDPAIREFLASHRDSAAVVERLVSVSAAAARDSTRRHIVLRDSTGVPVASHQQGAPLEPSPWVERTLVQHRPEPGEVIIGPLFARGDTVIGEAIAALPAVPRVESTASRESTGSRRAAGFISDTRVITGRGAEAIRQLMGENTSLVVGSSDGDVWTDLTRRAPSPPSGFAVGRSMIFASSARGPGVGAATAIRGTPWVLWVQQPRSVAIAPANRVLAQLVMLAILFILAGIVAGSILSRRITRPIVRMREAVERVAREAPSSAAVASSDGGGDEIERLAHAFERMSARVSESHEELEHRVAERTVKLADAVSALEAAQAQLVQKERLATLGQLASAVGHELRNPLGVMTNALYVIDHTLKDAPPAVKEYIDLVRGQIAVSERIVGDLLDTARIRPPQTEPVSLPELVDTQLQRHGPMHGVTVRREFPANLPCASVDPAQLAQILLNLFSNAAHAMTETNDGTLTIAGRAAPNGRVELVVRDTGPGIAPDVRERIFEPLFTTKARGLGLGLWVSRSLAAANHAELRLGPPNGAGATFILDMPAVVTGTATAT